MGFIDKIKQLMSLDKQIEQKKHDIAVFEQTLSNQQALYNDIVQRAQQEGEAQARQSISEAETRLAYINTQINGRNAYFKDLQDRIARKQEEETQIHQNLSYAESRLAQINTQINGRSAYLSDLQNRIAHVENKQTDETQIKQSISDAENKLAYINAQINGRNAYFSDLQDRITRAEDKLSKCEKDTDKQLKKLNKLSVAYKSAAYSIENYFNKDFADFDFTPPESLSDIELLLPTTKLQLHYEDLKDLRKLMKENNHAINKLFKKYESKYTTKIHRILYQLMILALRAELQNILSSLKYEKLDKAIADIRALTMKYLKITGEGNLGIYDTMTKFIGEVEYLFIEATKIEYEYYIRKQRIKEEQQAIREQMKQEAEERRLLAKQREQIEKEESKYQSEIEALKTQLSTTDEEKQDIINKRINELSQLLSEVENKKDEILNLQNGKAGHVYVISNIGSFGENVFKIGMTRRLEPFERIKELSSASVPFPFDVHSMIFSEDAVGLEHHLHTLLDAKRVNKVNRRKEFFSVDIDELEKMVQEYDPTAEFTKTVLAEQFRQSTTLSDSKIDVLPDILLSGDDLEDDE